MSPHAFLLDLALVLCAAAFTTVACQKLRLPVVLGYLLAGIIVGPHTPIPFFAHEETIRTLAELGREVLAVPGRVTDEQALGVNDLPRDGAGPVTHPADILERLGLPTGTRNGGTPLVQPELPPAQAALLAALDPRRDQAVDSLAAGVEVVHSTGTHAVHSLAGGGGLQVSGGTLTFAALGP